MGDTTIAKAPVEDLIEVEGDPYIPRRAFDEYISRANAYIFPWKGVVPVPEVTVDGTDSPTVRRATGAEPGVLRAASASYQVSPPERTSRSSRARPDGGRPTGAAAGTQFGTRSQSTDGAKAVSARRGRSTVGPGRAASDRGQPAVARAKADRAARQPRRGAPAAIVERCRPGRRRAHRAGPELERGRVKRCQTAASRKALCRPARRSVRRRPARAPRVGQLSDLAEATGEDSPSKGRSARRHRDHRGGRLHPDFASTPDPAVGMARVTGACAPAAKTDRSVSP